MGIIEGFLNTQQQLGQIQNQDLVNQSILAKLEEQKRAIADQQAVRATLARLNSETAPQAPTLAGMSEVPDAAAEMRGERKMEASPSAPTASAESVLKTNLATADAYEKKAKAIEALDPATAATFRKEADGYRTKAATLLSEQRKEQTEKLKTIANKLTAVTDQATLDAAFSGADPNALTQLFGQNLPRGLDGRVLATPDVIKLANNVGLQSMDAAKRMEIEQKAQEIEQKKKEEERKKKESEEGTWYQKQQAAAERERNRIREKEVDRRGAAADETTLTDDAISAAAEKYRLSGNLPPLGAGKTGAVMKAAILSKAAELAKAAGETGEEQAIRLVANTANKSALAQLTKQEQMVGAFEKNALKNLDIALQASKEVDRTGVPVLNRWLLAGRKSLAGDPAVSKFHAANTTFINEYAKIMSGSMGNTVVSDSLRKETESLLATKDTPEQYEATVNLMKQEMANRMKGFAEQKNELVGSMKNNPAKKETPKFEEGKVYEDAKGNKAKYVNGQWVPQP